MKNGGISHTRQDDTHGEDDDRGFMTTVTLIEPENPETMNNQEYSMPAEDIGTQERVKPPVKRTRHETTDNLMSDIFGSDVYYN